MHSSANDLIHKGFNFHQQGYFNEAERFYQRALSKAPKNFDALYLLGLLRLQTGVFLRSSELLAKAVALNPRHLDARLHLGAALAQAGNHSAAIDHFKQAQIIDPNNPMAFYSMGLTYAGLERYAEAIREFKKAVELNPNYVEAINNLGNALHNLGRYKEAADCFNNALRIAPGYLNALLGLSAALCKQEEYTTALIHINELIQRAPSSYEAHDNKGLVLAGMGKLEDAVAEYNIAIQLCSNPTSIFSNLGLAYAELKQYDQAFAAYNKSLELKPNNPDVYNNLGLAYVELKQYDQAIAAYNKSLELKPNNSDSYNNLGIAYAERKQYDQAFAAYNKSLELKPNNSDSYNNLGIAYIETKQYEQAIFAFETALNLDPSYKWISGQLLNTRMKICSWKEYEASIKILNLFITKKHKVTIPFPLLGLPSSLAEQQQAAVIYAKDKLGRIHASTKPVYEHAKIKIAYLSADYYNHATACLMAELFELHDRSRFEVIGICYGRSPSDEMRQRVAKGFDQFIEAVDKSDQEIADLIRDLEVDIAIDLKGHTQDSRLGILAHRPAPIQIHYLGYPGTLGAPFIDYLVADPVLIPPEHQAFYTEKIVYLPDTYQVNDRLRKIAETDDNRMDHGLPEKGFIFCCFNNNWKVTPEIFDAWMAILKQVEGSVLWLFKDNDLAAANLIKEAQARGIAAERLIFAEKRPLDQHLARLKHADLFLDTLYCNAHTTASDALWAGLPVLTKLGETYASRVAASLLTAIGLPELIAHSFEEYQALAVDLGTNAEKLEAIKKTLADNRLTAPLFDTPRFTKHLENAYEQMVARHQQGLPADHIYVPQS